MMAIRLARGELDPETNKAPEKRRVSVSSAATGLEDENSRKFALLIEGDHEEEKGKEAVGAKSRGSKEDGEIQVIPDEITQLTYNSDPEKPGSAQKKFNLHKRRSPPRPEHSFGGAGDSR